MKFKEEKWSSERSMLLSISINSEKVVVASLV